ncbi:hypothetical protein CISIN_1g046992mg, partial [Citrus sinensis]
ELFGIISPQISNLSKLEYLYLPFNQLFGKIPPEIGLLTHLKVTCTTWLVYFFIGQLKSLFELDLSLNQLSGSIFLSWVTLSNFSRVYIYDNLLSGTISPFIGNLTSLVDLQLNSNQLIGHIPNLRQNQFRGFLPSSIGNLTNLRKLFLRHNNLSGSLPLSIGNLTLSFLVLDTNQFTSYVPNICHSGLLEKYTNGNNRFLGPIPKSLRNCISLTTAYFAFYATLTFLDLSHNNFYNELSSNWAKCAKLGSLNFSIPMELGKLNSPTKLTLRENQLSGHLPRGLNSLIQLEYLDLSANSFSQSIPELCNLLNTAYNNLSSLIPKCFEKMHGLSGIDMSYNELEGSTPNSAVFRDAPLAALQKNKRLCSNVKGLDLAKWFFDFGRTKSGSQEQGINNLNTSGSLDD